MKNRKERKKRSSKMKKIVEKKRKENVDICCFCSVERSICAKIGHTKCCINCYVKWTREFERCCGPGCPRTGKMVKNFKRNRRFCNRCVKKIQDNKITEKQMLESLSTSIQNIDELYEIEKKLGEGGQGTVYKAKDKENNIVALKKLIVSKSNLIFLNDEMLISKKTLNPNILRYHDIYFDRKNIWMVMEYHPFSLMKIVHTIQLEEGDVATIVRDIASGLNYLHNIKLVHRDIKPDNIVISHNGVCKIIDFGMSAYLRGADNSRRSEVGTIDFMVSFLIWLCRHPLPFT